MTTLCDSLENVSIHFFDNVNAMEGGSGQVIYT